MEKVLILGGTNFIGRNLVEALLEQNVFDLTLFNRGQTNPNLFPEIKKIVGDRESGDMRSILRADWDYIVDLSCFFPGSLRLALQEVNPTLKRYIFISSCSVYDNNVLKTTLRNEEAPILSCNALEEMDTSDKSYGKRKAQCERVLKNSGITYNIFRPALVYGAYDNTDRFYYWLYQIQKEHELILPNEGKNFFSVTYVLDLVKAILKSLNSSMDSDTYNIITKPKMSILEVVETVSKIMDKKPKRHHVNSTFLNQNKISEWTDLPLWLDCDFYTYDHSKIIKDLNWEPTDFECSVKSTIHYFSQQAWNIPKFGMTDELRLKLIKALK